MDDVAEAAGVSHGLVFQYFGSKSGFYVAVLKQVLDEFRQRVDPNEDLDPIERLRGALRANIEWAAEHPKGYVSMVHRAHGAGDVQKLLEDSRRVNVEMVAQGMGADLSQPEARIALLGWTGFIDQALLAWLETREPGVEELINMLIGSLGGLLGFFKSDFTQNG